MTTSLPKWLLYIYAAFALTAIVVIADFAIPGRIITDEITQIQRNRQQYYNAAGNFHYSYKVITNEHAFQVKEAFGSMELENKKIEYSVSPLFKRVNWYRLLTVEKRSYHSLRLASGLILPLLLLLLLFLKFRYNKGNRRLLFIMQVLMIGNLIFIIAY